MRQCKLLLLFLLSISVLLSISKDALCDATNTTTPVNEVVNELRTNYRLFESAVTTAYTQDADTFLLQRLGDDIETFASIVNTVSPFVHFINNASTPIFDSKRVFSMKIQSGRCFGQTFKPCLLMYGPCIAVSLTTRI